jgi:hypothetical protein
VVSASYSSSTTVSGTSSYRNVNVSVRKSIFKKTSKEASYVRKEIAKILKIKKTLISKLRITSGSGVNIVFSKGVSKSDVKNYLSIVKTSTISSYTGLSSSVVSATYSSTTTTSTTSYRNVDVSVQKSIFKKSSKEVSHLTGEISKVLNIDKSLIKNIQVTSGRKISIEFSKSVSKGSVENYLSIVKTSTISSYTGVTSSVVSAGYSSSTISTTTSSYRNIQVSVKKGIFRRTSKEVSHVTKEISDILNIDESLIKNVHISSSSRLAIEFAKSVSKTSVEKYISTVKSSTLTSYTGVSSSVSSARYSSKYVSSTSSYRNVEVSVKKSIFEKSSKEATYVRKSIAKLLNIKRSLIKSLRVTSGSTVAIRFSKSVSKSDVQKYVSQVESSTLTSYTGLSSSVVSATYSSRTTTSTSTSGSVKINVSKGIFKQTSSEQKYLVKEFSKLFKCDVSQIHKVNILSGKQVSVSFDKSFSKYSIQARVGIVQTSSITSYSGSSSTVTYASYSSSTSTSAQSYHGSAVSVKKDIFEATGKEVSHFTSEFAKIFKVKKSQITQLKFISETQAYVYFSSSVSKSVVKTGLKALKVQSLTSYSGVTSSVVSTSYIDSKTVTSTTTTTGTTTTSESRTVAINVAKSIFQASKSEVTHVSKTIAKYFKCDVSQIKNVDISSGSQAIVTFSKSVSVSKIETGLKYIKSQTITSYTGTSSTVTSATTTTSTTSTTASTTAGKSVTINVAKSIFKESSSSEVSHLTKELSQIFKVKESLIHKIQVVNGKELKVTFDKAVTQSTIDTGVKVAEKNTIHSSSGQISKTVSVSETGKTTGKTTTSTIKKVSLSSEATKYGSEYKSVTNSKSSFGAVAVSKSIFKYSKTESTHLQSYFSEKLGLEKTSIKTVQILSPRDCRVVFDKSVTAQQAAGYLKNIEKTSITSSTGKSATIKQSYFVATQLMIQSSSRIYQLQEIESQYQMKQVSSAFKIQESQVQKLEILDASTCLIYLPVNVDKSALSGFKSAGIKSVTGQTSSIKTVQEVSATSTQLTLNLDKNALTSSAQEVSSLTRQIASAAGVSSSSIAAVSVISKSTVFVSFTTTISYTTLTTISTSTTITSVSNVQCLVVSTTMVGSTTHTVGVDSGTLTQSYSVSASSSSTYKKIEVVNVGVPGAPIGLNFCFASKVRAKTPTGYKTMSELSTGDLLETSTGYMTMYNKLDVWLHNEPTTLATFLNIQTAGNKSLLISGKHLLPLFEDCQQPDHPKIHWINSTYTMTRTADHARPGMCVGVRTDSGALRMDPIVNITEETHVGIYAPVTEEGFFFAEDIFVSCWSDVGAGGDRFYSVHGFLWISRWIYNGVTSLLSTVFKLSVPDWATSTPELYHQFNRLCDIFY